MLQAVENQTVFGKNDIAVFAGQFKNQLFSNYLSSGTDCINIYGNDTIQTALLDSGYTAFFQMLAQQHTKSRRTFGTFG